GLDVYAYGPLLVEHTGPWLLLAVGDVDVGQLLCVARPLIRRATVIRDRGFAGDSTLRIDTGHGVAQIEISDAVAAPEWLAGDHHYGRRPGPHLQQLVADADPFALSR